MNKFDIALLKWKFKKIAIIYIIVTLIAAVGCAAAAGIVFRDRISFAWQYSRVSEAIEKKDQSILQSKIDKLASSSSNVIDILIVDKNNQVTYSAKKTEFGSGTLMLTKSGDEKEYLVSNKSNNVVFKYVKGDEFMLNSVFNEDFGSIKDEYEDNSFYENNFSNKTIYMLSYIGEKKSETKVYIISDPTSVPGGMITLKIDACVSMLFFMIYWVLLAFWAYQNALKSKLYPLFWGIIVLLTNIVGVIVYQLYKHGNATCPDCSAVQSKSHIFCSFCGKQLGDTCSKCGAHISKKDFFCHNCGAQIK